MQVPMLGATSLAVSERSNLALKPPSKLAEASLIRGQPKIAKPATENAYTKVPCQVRKVNRLADGVYNAK